MVHLIHGLVQQNVSGMQVMVLARSRFEEEEIKHFFALNQILPSLFQANFDFDDEVKHLLVSSDCDGPASPSSTGNSWSEPPGPTAAPLPSGEPSWPYWFGKKIWDGPTGSEMKKHKKSHKNDGHCIKIDFVPHADGFFLLLDKEDVTASGKAHRQ